MSSPVIIGPLNPSGDNPAPMFSSGPVNQQHAFPALTPSQIEHVRAFGKVRKVEAGEILFEPGDMTVPFFVLLSGSMEIVQPGLHGGGIYRRDDDDLGPGRAGARARDRAR
jgi:hypothetical protein